MASIGYAKPHYRLLSPAQKSVYIREWEYDEENWIPSIHSSDIYRVIKSMQAVLRLNVTYLNNQYWVVSYPQGQVYA
jgi:hypothetical protein